MSEKNTTKIELTLPVQPEELASLAEFIEKHADLSRRKLKEAISKGAVWVKRGKGQPRRVYRPNYLLKVNDVVSLFYDEATLIAAKINAFCIADLTQYSVWYKPPGLSLSGDKYADFNSLERQAGVFFDPPRDLLIVNQMPEQLGEIVLIAHKQSAFSKLSVLFARHKVSRHYRVKVDGKFKTPGETGIFDQTLDNKPSHTEYCAGVYNSEQDYTVVDVTVNTLRKYQILRHFEGAGYTIVYDADNPGMPCIIGTGLTFDCPVLKQSMQFELEEKHLPY